MCMSQLVLCNTPPRIQLPRPTGVSLPVAQWVGWLFWAGRLQAAFSEPAGRLLVWQIPSAQESRQATETEGGPLTSTSLPSARARPRPSPAAVSREAPPPPGRPGRGPNPIRGREELAARPGPTLIPGRWEDQGGRPCSAHTKLNAAALRPWQSRPHPALPRRTWLALPRARGAGKVV